MAFATCGLNHKTAPIDLREKVASSAATHQHLLENLLQLPEVHEAAILSTCNRTEIYCDTSDPNVISQWLAHTHQLPHASLAPHFYVHEGHQAMKHSLRVASGLDSMMLGEPQILGQMKQAYQQALRMGSIKSQLRPVFEYIFSASKRIRTLSGIGTNPVSIAYAAVQLVGQLFTDFQQLKVFLIGSGETMALVAKYLQQQGASQFMVASRTLENAYNLAHSVAGTSLSIGEIPHYLPQADVIITATACPLPFITKIMVQQALKIRQNAPMFFLDLALPRDIEAQVAELEYVQLFNIDDLQHVVEKGLDGRRDAALQAEQLIDSELDNFIRWHRSLNAKDIICSYRESMQELAQKELQKAMQKLAQGGNQEQILQEFSARLVNKLTHNPTAGLRKMAWDNREDLLTLAHYLFTTSTSKQTQYEKIS